MSAAAPAMSAITTPGAAKGLPDNDHRVALAAGWTVWRQSRVKSSGFPARRILSLASDGAARAVDQLLVDQRAEAVRLAQCIEAGEALVPNLDHEEFKTVRKALRRLRKGRVPEQSFGGPFGDQLELLRACHQRTSAQVHAAATAMTAGSQSAGEALRKLAVDPRFREALALQNRAALQGGMTSLLRRPASATDAKTREHERLAASYLQRYYVKNDTIGFFGPVGWAELGAATPHLNLRPGPDLVRRPTIHFEYWGVDTLARSASEDDELRLHMAPRRLPFVRVDGVNLYCPGNDAVEIGPEIAAVLTRCDGQRSALALAAELVSNTELDFEDEDEVIEQLEALVEAKLVLWALELPTSQPRPEVVLAKQLSALPPLPARLAAEERLARLNEARHRLEQALGDADRVQAESERLEACFERVTGSVSKRRAGETYAARGLSYVDACRDMDLKLGPAFLERLGPPLALLLHSARWFSYEVAEAYRDRLDALFTQLQADLGRPELDYLTFWQHAQSLFNLTQGEQSTIVRDIATTLKQRWGDILGLDCEARRESRTCAELHDRVQELFAAPHPGWPSARYQSPDILVAAAGGQAFARGEYRPVIGELHIGTNTLLPLFALEQHQDPQSLLAARRVDLPAPTVVPVETREGTTRADHLSLASDDFSLELGYARSWRSPGQTLAAADLVVSRGAAGLRVCSRDGVHAFDIVEFLEQYLVFACLGHFSILAKAPHLPRLTIDGVVVQREAWTFEPEQLGFARATTPADRFTEVRRWAHAHRLPRHIFYKVPEEPKPYFADLASPPYVELLSKVVRSASSLSLSEMLPEFGDLWLSDNDGELYTCELRLAAVDPQRWRPPSPNYPKNL